VQEIVHYGDAAADACRGVLTNFVEYLRNPSRAKSFGDM
jgi:hypothetical protein